MREPAGHWVEILMTRSRAEVRVSESASDVASFEVVDEVGASIISRVLVADVSAAKSPGLREMSFREAEMSCVFRSWTFLRMAGKLADVIVR